MQSDRASEPVARKESQSVRPRKCAALREDLGLRPREPDELRRLHLRRQRAAEVAQNLMAGGVDPRGVLGRAVIHPHDHVAFGRAGGVDRQRLQALVERDERTGRGEAEAGESVARGGRDASTASRTASVDRAPDVGGRLLDDVAGLAPDRDRSPGAAEEPPRANRKRRRGRCPCRRPLRYKPCSWRSRVLRPARDSGFPAWIARSCALARTRKPQRLPSSAAALAKPRIRLRRRVTIFMGRVRKSSRRVRRVTLRLIIPAGSEAGLAGFEAEQKARARSRPSRAR